METVIEHSKTNEDLASLTEEFQVWLNSNGLPQRSADELLAEEETALTEPQRLFLGEFCSRWESAADEMGLGG